MHFVDSSANFKNYILQNILILKMLHDRGICIRGDHMTGDRGLTVSDLLEYMFGPDVTIEEADIVLPDGIEEFPEPDSEEEFLLVSFKERPQFIFQVPFPFCFACNDTEIKELLAALGKAVIQDEEAMYMFECFLLKASINANIVTMRFVDYHPQTNIDDEGVNILFLYEPFINFYDKVVEIAGRRTKKYGRHILKNAN